MSGCDMCGVSSERLHEVIVEGTMLNVCAKCKGYGNTVVVNIPVESVGSNNMKVPRKIYVEETVVFVVEGAGRIISVARDEKCLTQKQFAKMVGIKESMVHKIETSMIKPDISTARKIENILDVKIIEDYKDPEKSVPFNLHDENLTIGDLVKFKKTK